MLDTILDFLISCSCILPKLISSVHHFSLVALVYASSDVLEIALRGNRVDGVDAFVRSSVCGNVHCLFFHIITNGSEQFVRKGDTKRDDLERYV